MGSSTGSGETGSTATSTGRSRRRRQPGRENGRTRRNPLAHSKVGPGRGSRSIWQIQSRRRLRRPEELHEAPVGERIDQGGARRCQCAAAPAPIPVEPSPSAPKGNAVTGPPAGSSNIACSPNHGTARSAVPSGAQRSDDPEEVGLAWSDVTAPSARRTTAYPPPESQPRSNAIREPSGDQGEVVPGVTRCVPDRVRTRPVCLRDIEPQDVVAQGALLVHDPAPVGRPRGGSR